MKVRIYAYSDKYQKWVDNAPMFYVALNKEVRELNELANAMINSRLRR